MGPLLASVLGISQILRYVGATCLPGDAVQVATRLFIIMSFLLTLVLTLSSPMHIAYYLVLCVMWMGNEAHAKGLNVLCLTCESDP